MLGHCSKKRTRHRKEGAGNCRALEVTRRQEKGRERPLGAAEASPVYRIRLIIPGITMRNMGSSFRYPHMMQPAFT